MRVFLAVCLLLQVPQAWAGNDWLYQQQNDRVSNRQFSYARSPMPRTDLYDDMRLDIVCKDNKLALLIETDVLISSQGSAFELEYQIDQQNAVKLPMRTLPDSKRKGFAEAGAKALADAMLGGHSIFIRVNTMIKRVLTGEMALTNASAAIQRVYADCGLEQSNSQQDYSVAQFSADFSRLSAAQQQAGLQKLKALVIELQTIKP